MKRSIWLARFPGSFSPRRMATAVAAALSLSAGTAGAADCSCARQADFPAPGVCSCESSWGHGRAEPGPIYQTLDAFAGGIEKLLCLDGSSRDVVCDDACDAAMVDELSHAPWPAAPGHSPHRHHVEPQHRHHGGSFHDASPYAEPHAGDSMQMSRPQIEPLPESEIPERPLDRTRRRSGGRALESVPPGDASRDSHNGTAAPAEDFQDPFLDDSVRVDPRGSRFVQPAAYKTARAPRVSSRRVKSSR